MRSKNLVILSILLFCSSAALAQWTEVQKVVASDRLDTDFYGYAVAISGDYALVGAYLEDEDEAEMNTIPSTGSVYIYERDAGGVWNQVQKIVSSDRALNDEFGYALSISGDYAVIGARWEDHAVGGGSSMFNAGSAYVFERDAGGVWNEVQKIVASDRANSDEFGSAVSISGDYLVVGAEREDQNVAGSATLSEAGSAYIFERDAGGVWNEVQKVVASDRELQDKFGHAVSVSGDYMIITADEEDHDAVGGSFAAESGSAYVFERDAGGTWNEVQKIVSSDREEFDEFGKSVSLDGTYAVIGASWEDHDASGGAFASNAGSAYIFERDAGGVWNETQKIVASDRAAQDDFGWSVSISGDHVAVGANFEDEDATGSSTLMEAGSVYIYKRNGSGVWNQVDKIVSSDRDVEDLVGTSVGISGTYVIAGAYWEDHDEAGLNFLDRSGSAYIFEGMSCETSSTITPTSCGDYTSPSGSYTYTTTGVYMDTIPNAAACDSVITIDLTVTIVDTSVTPSATELTANATAVTYQWVDCDDSFNPIAGASSQEFTPTVTGNYAVIITDGACSDTSSCYAFDANSGSGISETDLNSILLLPNPGNGSTQLVLPRTFESISLIVYSADGKLTQTLHYVDVNQIDLQFDHASGLYVIHALIDKKHLLQFKYMNK